MKKEALKTYIRFLEESDTQALTDFEIENRLFFQKFLLPQDDEFYTYEYQNKLIKNNITQSEKDKKYVFGIFDKSIDKLIGKMTLANIMRGPMQSCEIGGYVDRKYNWKGYSFEGTNLVVRYGFEELGLNRIYAYIMPSNLASIRVLKRIGFLEEGIIRKYLFFKGNWEDHLLMSIVAEEKTIMFRK